MPEENKVFQVVQRAVYHPHQGVKLRINNTAHSYWVNEELSFDSANTKMTGIDHFIGGVASSIVLAIMRFDQQHDQQIDQVEARLVFDVRNPLTYIGVVGCDEAPSIDRIHMVIYAVSLAETKTVEDIVDQALHRCVVFQTLRRAVHFDVRVKETY